MLWCIPTSVSADGSDEETDLVIDTHVDLGETGRFVRVTVRLVPETEAYPEGVKYRMHYGDYDGTTIVRYDTAHAETKGHERHTQSGTEQIDFPGWRALLRRFRQEVTDHERTTDN